MIARGDQRVLNVHAFGHTQRPECDTVRGQPKLRVSEIELAAERYFFIAVLQRHRNLHRRGGIAHYNVRARDQPVRRAVYLL